MDRQPTDASERPEYCPGAGMAYRPFPCGRDVVHLPHDVGLPPGKTYDINPTSRTLINLANRRRTVE